MTTPEILEQQLGLVWGEEGYGFISGFNNSAEVQRKRVWVDLSKERPYNQLSELINQWIAEERDIYYCPAALKEGKSATHPDGKQMFNAKENVLGSSVLWAEYDKGTPAEHALQPSLVIESSPGKFHIYWKLDTFVTNIQAIEYYNRTIAAKTGADLSGWDANQLLRVAGTTNFKPGYQKPTVEIRELNDITHTYVEPDLSSQDTTEDDRPEFTGEMPQVCIDLIMKAAQVSVARDKAEAYLDGEKFDRSSAYASCGLSMYEAGFNQVQVAQFLKSADNLLKKWDSNYRARDAKREADRLWRKYDQKRAELAELTFTGLQPASNDSIEEKKAEQFFTSGADMGGFYRRRWLFHELIPLGYFTICAGRPKLGKSTLAAQWAADLTNGKSDGEFKGQPKDVLIVAMEEFWDDWGPRLTAAGADMKKVQFWTWPQKPTFPKDAQGLMQYIESMRAYGIDPALMIIDPILSRMDSNLDTYKESDVRKALETVAQLSNQLKMTTLGIIHWNGSNSPTLALNIMGSKAVAGVSRATLHVIESPDSTDDKKVSLYGMDEGSYSHNTKCGAFTFEQVELDAIDGKTQTSRLVMLEDAEGSISTNWKRRLAKTNQDVQGRDGRPKKKNMVDLAKEWILDYLGRDENSAGSTPSIMMAVAKAEDLRFSKAQFYPALAQLVDEGHLKKEAMSGQRGNPVVYSKITLFANLMDFD